MVLEFLMCVFTTSVLCWDCCRGARQTSLLWLHACHCCKMSYIHFFDSTWVCTQGFTLGCPSESLQHSLNRVYMPCFQHLLHAKQQGAGEDCFLEMVLGLLRRQYKEELQISAPLKMRFRCFEIFTQGKSWSEMLNGKLPRIDKNSQP